MKYLRDHSRHLDEAFEGLEEVTERELHLVDDKILEIDHRLNKNGPRK